MTQYNSVTQEIIEQIVVAIGAENVYTDEVKKEPYSHDELVGKKYNKIPELVVLPTTPEQVAAVVKIANEHTIPVIARGAGTAFTSASVALFGGIVISTERMNQILEIDEENMFMVVEPGATTATVQKAANEKGFLYAGDPCSGDSSFIGGNIGTNAGGNKAVKYGTTRQQVAGVEIVTAEGDIVTLGGKLKKDSSGYNLFHLIIGSEGTLGIVTKCYLRLVPLPESQMDVLAVFPSLKTAIEVVPKIMSAGVNPVCVEFMDNGSVRNCEAYLNESLPDSENGNYIIVSIEGDNEELLEEQLGTIDEICTENGASSVLIADPERIWKARKIYAEADRAISIVTSMEDIVVPTTHIPETIETIAELGEKYGLTIHCAGHAGDGNIHANILKKDLSDEEWDEKLHAIQEEIYAKVYELGGKLSGEHGIGYKRKAVLAQYTNPVEIKLMQAVKKALDPKNILNPGKVIDVE